jgi:3-isopropylmalate/(R)-2-methylmalate dehydratase large subunit
VTGAVRFNVPRSLLVEFTGSLAPGVTAKDLVLHLLATRQSGPAPASARSSSSAGPAVALLSLDERTTLTNMTAELGGFSGIVAPDAETVRFLRERRGIDFTIEPWMHSDPGAQYAEVVTIDCSTLSPMVALPGDPGNALPLGDLEERTKFDIAYGGSCTAGKREDFDHYHEVLAWAVERGLKAAPGVKLYLQFGTAAVRDYCIERGYLPTFERAGAELLQPACGACANCGPGSSTEPGAGHRQRHQPQFPGRSGPGKVWLASPPTPVAGELVSFETLPATPREHTSRA